MVQDTFITFETAKLAQQKGFTLREVANIIYYTAYKEDGGTYCSLSTHLHLDDPAYVPQSVLQKWLREKHNAHISILYTKNAYDVKYSIQGIDGHYTGAPTYEFALETVLIKLLKKLKDVI